MERLAGIEPALRHWQCLVIPVDHSRMCPCLSASRQRHLLSFRCKGNRGPIFTISYGSRTRKPFGTGSYPGQFTISARKLLVVRPVIEPGSRIFQTHALPFKLTDLGAGGENRTPADCVEGSGTTIMQHPHGVSIGNRTPTPGLGNLGPILR